MAPYLFVVLALVTPSQGLETNPIGKVVQLLSDLEAKIIREGEGAQKIYAEYSEWCEDRSRNVGFEIETGKREVADLKASIAQDSATIDSLTSKVEDHAAAIATNEADLSAATNIRDQEAADFAAQEKELADVIDTLGRAISIISREMQKGGSAMVQLKHSTNLAQALSVLVQASALQSADATKLAAFVQSAQAADDDDSGAPAAAVYKSQSGDIVSTLENLKDEAEDQLASARKAETTNRHNFEMLKQSLEDEIKFNKKDMAAAKNGIAQSEQSKSSAQGDLDVTSKDLKADIEQKADLHHDCMSKAEEFQTSTKSRGEELKALAEAKKVIKEATGGATDITYGLNQVSFVQKSGISTRADLAGLEAVRLVRDLARKENAPMLAQLAVRMGAVLRSSGSDDVFGKVKALIRDMIDRLEDTASADATEKAYCDKELSESADKKADKEAEIQKLTTSIDQMAAKSAQLKEQVAALQKSLAELASSQAEMNKMRQEEHAIFVSDKADLEQGVAGVQTALKVLRDYYASEKGHAAAEGAGQGIIGLLEVCESDFSKGLADMVASEEAAQSSYDRATKENEIETATKDQDVKYKNAESTSLDKSVSEASSDRSGVQDELDAVLDYRKSLKARCVAKAESYSERAARRAAEIDGLRQALEILNSQTALLQQGAVHFLRRHSA
jgi:predicted  nucleic acid-binding Zn-ribbon protein